VRTRDEIDKAVHDLYVRLKDNVQEYQNMSARFDLTREQFASNHISVMKWLNWGAVPFMLCITLIYVLPLLVHGWWLVAAEVLPFAGAICFVIQAMRGNRRSRALLDAEGTLLEHMKSLTPELSVIRKEAEKAAEELQMIDGNYTDS
jgi:hypothetical protein